MLLENDSPSVVLLSYLILLVVLLLFLLLVRIVINRSFMSSQDTLYGTHHDRARNVPAKHLKQA